MDKTNFCLQFLDLKSKKKLTNKKAQIINIQSKQTYTETLINGEINLLIDKENIADFYLAYLIAEDKSRHYAFNLAKEFKEEDGKQAPSYTTQKILTPRSYEKSKARLYFKECNILLNENEVAIIKCYKVLNDELEKERKKQEGYDYFLDSKDELFVADCEQTVAFQAYFYKDLEGGKSLANKKRELLDNESAKTCLDLDKVQWCIETKGKQVLLQGNPIFFRPKDLGFKNEDTLSIKARLKEETRNFIQKRQVYYKEVFKIDGNLLGKKTHLVIDRLAQLNIALEHRYSLVYDYRGLFLYENRKELCKLYTKQIEGLKDYIELRDKKHTYKVQMTHKDKGTVYLHIHKEAEAKRVLCFSYDEKDEHLITKAFKQTSLPLRYYKPTKYVIFINRHSQNVKYTLSSYEILERQGDKGYERVKEYIASGVMIEPCGPDGLLAGNVLRIPKGHYKFTVASTGQGLREYMMDGSSQMKLPRLYDGEFVFSYERYDGDKARTAILIHSGTNVLESPLDRTEGCLLIGRGFDGLELITHGEYPLNYEAEKEELRDLAKQINKELVSINNLKGDKRKKEFDRLNAKFYEKYGNRYKDKIEPYINSSIKKLMAFINKHKATNFTVHIKNDFKDK